MALPVASGSMCGRVPSRRRGTFRRNEYSDGTGGIAFGRFGGRRADCADLPTRDASAHDRHLARRVRTRPGGTQGWNRRPEPSRVPAGGERGGALVAGAPGAGLLVLLGVAMAFGVNSWWVLLSGFVGLGRTVAGLTKFCPMAACSAGCHGTVRDAVPLWERSRQARNKPSPKFDGAGNFGETMGAVDDFENLANPHKDAVYRQMVRVC
jgi:hypothetical protein